MKIPVLLKTIIISLFLFLATKNEAANSGQQTDLIIYSYDRPLQLYALLESIEQNVTGLSHIFVIVRSSSIAFSNAYQIVKSSFAHVEFKHQEEPYNDLKQLTLDCFSKTNHAYIIFGVDDIIIKDPINIAECINALEITKSHGFFLRLGKNLDYCYAMSSPQQLPPLKNINQNILTWQFCNGEHDWAYPNNLDFTLYRKADLEDALISKDYRTPNSLESQLAAIADLNQSGLCYENSKIVNLPLNLVQTEFQNPCAHSYSTQQLLDHFNQGKKIDVSAFQGVLNKSAHLPDSTLIKFISRIKESEQKLIIIVTPSYNNKEWWEWNLSSLINQDYTNYRIIITDDCSPDGTGQSIATYIKENNLENKVTLIQNKERRGALHNLYYMIHSCPDNAIIVTVDGDDALYDSHVLSQLNAIYSEQDIWLTYGQFIEHPSGAPGWCCPMPDHIVKNNAFREHQHIPSHLRTFYAWLFKSIKLEDMLDRRGDFYTMTWDYAMMLPMIEMAGERHRCLEDQIMYVYNNANAISDHKISRQLQAHIAQVIRAKNKYQRLPAKPECSTQQTVHEKVDFIIFAEESTPQILDLFLDSIQQYATGVANIYVLYQSSSSENENYYTLLKEKYQGIWLLKIQNNPESFRVLLSAIYFHASHSNYIVFARAHNKIIEPLNLNTCIQALEETQAYAFSLRLSKERCHYPPPSRLLVHEIKPTICAWNYALANGAWSCACSMDMVLYHKDHRLASYILDQNYWVSSSWDFEGTWANLGNLDKIGLCFKDPKVILT